jgi:DNA-binding beta-propeller fold protein YncE
MLTSVFFLLFISLSFSQTATVVARVGLPYAVTLDNTEANLYVSAQTNGGKFVYRINTATGDTATVASGFGCYGICLDQTGTGLYVGTGSSSNSQVSKLSLPNYAQSSFATGMAAPSGFALNPSGTKLFVCDRTNYRVVSINTATGAVTPLFSTSGTYKIARPFGMTMDKSGRLWVTSTMTNGIAIIDTNGTLLDSITSANVPQIQYPLGLNLDPSGTYIYVTSGYGYIYKIKVATKEVTIFRDITAQPVLGQLYNGVINRAGTALYVGDFANNIVYKVTLGPSATEDEQVNIKNYNLSQNYPNPFNPATTINYQIAKTGPVTLTVYDALGREVKSLVNEVKSPGQFSVQLNANNLQSGVYFYTLRAGDFISTKKLILLQ